MEAFEEAFAEQTGARHAVAFAVRDRRAGTAAAAAGLGEGDRMTTTPLSFVASSNCALFVGARPSFHDVDWATANLDTAAALAAGVRRREGVRRGARPGCRRTWRRCRSCAAIAA